jgi:hypothetical protein
VEQVPVEDEQRPVDDHDSDHDSTSEDMTLYDLIIKSMKDLPFVSKYDTVINTAPIPIVAAAVAIINGDDDLPKWFHNHSMECIFPVHRESGTPLHPNYHMIEGTSLVYVDWRLHFGKDLNIFCPELDPLTHIRCNGVLKEDRTNFSKNKKLFPVFRIGSLPSWCIVQSYWCLTCGKRMNANEGNLLMCLPEYVRNAYPVDPKYASAVTTWHIDRATSDMVEELMITYGNGDQLSKMLFTKMSKDYHHKRTEYLSYWRDYQQCEEIVKKVATPPYPELHEYMTFKPPSGHSLRNLFDEACLSPNTPYGISDHNRCTREIQSVGTNSMFAQDHTMEVTKNYRATMGARAVWDVAIETGEIACAVLVGKTSVKDFAHAAEAMIRRPNFNPVVMYSDTWPNKDSFWKLFFGDDFEGRLGLFHYEQRIIKTLRQGHIDYHKAIKDLCNSVYSWESKSFNKLLAALSSGTLGNGGKPMSNQQIQKMMCTSGEFRKKYAKYLMKCIREPEIIRQMLTEWFNQYKMVSSDPFEEAGSGRVDPHTKKLLFTPETRGAVLEQKKNAGVIQDKLSLCDMYREVRPTKATKHGLSEYISLRCESKLERFHADLANFANGGMRMSLCDNINLMGTARYNVRIRHKFRIAEQDPSINKNIGSHWLNQPETYNHCELEYIQKLSKEAGLPEVPFKYARPLPDDNGERFFGLYWVQEIARRKKYKESNLNDRCWCPSCGCNPIKIGVDTKYPNNNITMDNDPLDALASVSASATYNEMTVTTVATTTAIVNPVNKRTALAANVSGSSPSRIVHPKVNAPITLKVNQPMHIHPNNNSGQHHNMMHLNHMYPPPMYPQSYYGGTHAMYPMPYYQHPQLYPATNDFGFTNSHITNHASASAPAIPLIVKKELPEGNATRTKRPKAQHQACCPKYTYWATFVHNGRPPHDTDCPNRKNPKKKYEL